VPHKLAEGIVPNGLAMIPLRRKSVGFSE